VRVDSSEREQHIVDEADRRCRALNVEEDAFGHLPDNYARYVVLKHTGSNFASTALSVYRGVHPAAS
jgi:hypothetical protein